jgi:fatty-acid desaturase
LYMCTKSAQPLCFVSSHSVALFIGLLSVLGATAGAHRLWAHRSYSASTPLRILLMICQTALGQVRKQSCVLLHKYTLFCLTQRIISFNTTRFDRK